MSGQKKGGVTRPFCWVHGSQDPRRTFDYAFSPTAAILNGTPQPPIPQYPSGLFAKYCWWQSALKRYQHEVSTPFEPKIAKNLLHSLEFSFRKEKDYLNELRCVVGDFIDLHCPGSSTGSGPAA